MSVSITLPSLPELEGKLGELQDEAPGGDVNSYLADLFGDLLRTTDLREQRARLLLEAAAQQRDAKERTRLLQRAAALQAEARTARDARAQQIERNQGAIALLDSWLAEDVEEDLRVWKDLETALPETRTRF